jgi:hypothetical protein
MAPPSSRGSSRSGSSSRGGPSRGGSSGGGGSTNTAATIVSVAVVGLIIGGVVLMSGKKKDLPQPKIPASVPVAAPKATPGDTKPPPPPYPDMPAAKVAEAAALVRTFEADASKAEGLYKESQQAKKDGDDVKWQAKLKEAKDLVSDIKDKWNDFIAGLPTSKDYDQEEVARHYLEKENGRVAQLTKVLAAMKSDER